MHTASIAKWLHWSIALSYFYVLMHNSEISSLVYCKMTHLKIGLALTAASIRIGITIGVLVVLSSYLAP